jgi:hypothetical protein
MSIQQEVYIHIIFNFSNPSYYIIQQDHSIS